jgi:hypothetical protein
LFCFVLLVIVALKQTRRKTSLPLSCRVEKKTPPPKALESPSGCVSLPAEAVTNSFEVSLIQGTKFTEDASHGICSPTIGERLMNRTTKIFLAMASTLIMAGCAPEIGSTQWCDQMKEKPKGDWTANEATEYAKNCVFRKED